MVYVYNQFHWKQLTGFRLFILLKKYESINLYNYILIYIYINESFNFSKWKPILSQQNGQTSVYQIVKIDSASFYCNTMCSTLLYTNKTMVSDWQDKMRSGLNNFNINEEPLEFSEYLKY